MQKSFQEIRDVGIEGVDTLVWRKSDVGAFGNRKDGPLFDWIEGSKYFMKYVKKFDLVIQAGGCCGMYPRFYGNYFKSVYTFEPHPLNFACLDLNCVGEQYHKYNGILSDLATNTNAITNGSDKNVGMYQVDKTQSGNIQSFRIDDLEITECDLIHLDVEGHEETVLKGALETIKKFKPVVIVERNSGAGLLQSLGYHGAHKLRMDSIFIL